MALIGMASLLGVAEPRASTVAVSAYPLWTDTGIALDGSPVTIRGFGTWDFGASAPTTVGPDGMLLSGPWAWLIPLWLPDEWVPDLRHGELIAYVGMNPYYEANYLFPDLPTRPYDPLDYHPIGSGPVTFSGLSGELWLGINDERLALEANRWTGVSDNTGSLTASISSSVPDAGSTLTLFCLTIMGLLALTVRRPGSVARAASSQRGVARQGT